MTYSPFQWSAVHGRVLLIEEPSVFREVQLLMLRGAGYDVSVTEHLASALERLAADLYHVVVLNSEKIDADAVPYIEAIRRTQPNSSIVFASASITLELSRRLLELGVTAVMNRPFAPAALVEKIDAVMGLPPRPAAPPAFHAPAGRAEPTGVSPSTSVRIEQTSLPPESASPFAYNPRRASFGQSMTVVRSATHL